MPAHRTIRLCSLTHKLLRYGPSVELQERLVEHRKVGTIGDTLLVVQHAPVFTIGKRGSIKDFRTTLEELHTAGIEVQSVPRGGETTYHGPGQLVAYPIINLRQLGLGARAFVEGLEDAMVQTAGCFGIHARGHVPGKTGVWVGDRKIGAVGVRITHGISSHGIALNVCTDLSCYRHIVPCGTPDKEVTSVQQELLRAGLGNSSTSNSSLGAGNRGDARQQVLLPAVDLAVAEQHLVQSLTRVFEFDAVEQIPEEQL